jgi:hypothetical protein
MKTFEYLDIIVTIVMVFIMGGACALFSYLLDYCFWEGSIFGGYLPWLSRKLMKWLHPAEYNELNIGNKETIDHNMLQASDKIFLFKVLGGCSVCTNVWITNISYITINLLLGIGWWYMIVYVVSSSFILRKIMKI